MPAYINLSVAFMGPCDMNHPSWKKKRHPDKTQLDVNQEMRQHIYAKNPPVKISLSKCKFIMISFFFLPEMKTGSFFSHFTRGDFIWGGSAEVCKETGRTLSFLWKHCYKDKNDFPSQSKVHQSKVLSNHNSLSLSFGVLFSFLWLSSMHVAWRQNRNKSYSLPF